MLAAGGVELPRPRARFGHGAELGFPDAPAAPRLLGLLPSSQQNTFTGKLTAPMIDEVLRRARAIAGLQD